MFPFNVFLGFKIEKPLRLLALLRVQPTHTLDLRSIDLWINYNTILLLRGTTASCESSRSKYHDLAFEAGALELEPVIHSRKPIGEVYLMRQITGWARH